MIKYIILGFILFIFSCKESKEYGNLQLPSRIQLTNIECLKNNLSEFNNDTLRIRGKLFIEFENVGIVNDGISIWINNFKPAVKIEFGDENYEILNNTNVEIIGKYKSGKTGHLGLYDGEFEEIFFIKTD